MQVALFCALIALAGLIQGMLGFASALVAVPLALIFLPQETVVSSMFMVGLSLNGYLSLPFPSVSVPRAGQVLPVPIQSLLAQ